MPTSTLVSSGVLPLGLVSTKIALLWIITNICIRPEAEVNQTLKVFKAAQLFSPQNANSMQPTALDIKFLSVFLFFDNTSILGRNCEHTPSTATIFSCL